MTGILLPSLIEATALSGVLANEHATLPINQSPRRTLYLPEQVNQESMNKLTKSIIDINNSDRILRNSTLNDIEYTPPPIEIYIDSYGGAVYQCFGCSG
jgi:ATP-dependent protease ClpP protease subunit